MKWILWFVFKKCWKWNFQDEITSSLKSYVMIGAPHTSNWDIVPAMAIAHNIKGHARFVIKSSWIRFPFKALLYSMGALGLDREKIKALGANNTTDAMAKLFKQYNDFVLMIAPEGTRSKNANWKSGFYYIAKKAQVPIVLGFADYEKKVAGVGKVIYPTDFDNDIQEIMDFYANIRGRRPEKFALRA